MPGSLNTAAAPGSTVSQRSMPVPVPPNQSVPLIHHMGVPVPRGGSTAGQPIKVRVAATAPSPTILPAREAAAADPSENLTAPALSCFPYSVPVVDPNADIMTEGLKLQQQKWPEKNEVRKLFSDLTRLTEMLCALSLVQGNTGMAWEICQSIRAMVNRHLLNELRRLNQRITSMVQAQAARDNDIKAFKARLTERSAAVERLRDHELVSANRILVRAKRRRQYQQEFERVASDILTKKPREVYRREFEQESAKLRETEESLERWGRITQLRKVQADGVLLHIRDMLQSLKDPASLLALVETPSPSTRGADDAVSTPSTKNG